MTETITKEQWKNGLWYYTVIIGFTFLWTIVYAKGVYNIPLLDTTHSILFGLVTMLIVVLTVDLITWLCNYE